MRAQVRRDRKRHALPGAGTPPTCLQHARIPEGVLSRRRAGGGRDPLPSSSPTPDVCAPGTCGRDRRRGPPVNAPPPGVLVHRLGLCESTDIGRGTRIWAFAHVMAGATIGTDCNICDHVFVESGVRVGDRVTVKNGAMLFDCLTIESDAFIGPGVVFTNDLRPRAWDKKPREDFLPTLVQRGATIGARAVILCGTQINAFAFVAAGSV